MFKFNINKAKYNKVFLIKRENALFARVYLQKGIFKNRFFNKIGFINNSEICLKK